MKEYPMKLVSLPPLISSLLVPLHRGKHFAFKCANIFVAIIETYI